jgi:hypothetical protein
MGELVMKGYPCPDNAPESRLSAKEGKTVTLPIAKYYPIGYTASRLRRTASRQGVMVQISRSLFEVSEHSIFEMGSSGCSNRDSTYNGFLKRPFRARRDRVFRLSICGCPSLLRDFLWCFA